MANNCTETSIHGYDAVFHPKLDERYTCPVCLTALKDPVQTICGHRFCRACLATAMGNKKKGRCPVDKTWFTSSRDIFEDNAVKREVLSLSVKCHNHSEGCEWSGELRDLQGHMEECPFASIKCENCDTDVRRQDMEEHLPTCPRRLENCMHCSEPIIFADMPKHQLLECQKFPVNCGICGETGILREQISQHVDVEKGNCPLVMVPCDFYKLGCFFQDKRKNMLEHYHQSKSHHQSLIISKIVDLSCVLDEQEKASVGVMEEFTKYQSLIDRQNRLIESQDELLATQETKLFQLETTNHTGQILWKIRLSECNGRKVTSPSFYTSSPGYKVQLVFDIHGYTEGDVTYSSLSLNAVGGRFDDHLKYPLQCRCKVTLLHQDDFSDTDVVATFKGCCREPLPYNSCDSRTIGKALKFVKLPELMQGCYLKDGEFVLDIQVSHVVVSD